MMRISSPALFLALGTACSSIQGANPDMPLWKNRPGMAISVEFQRKLADESPDQGVQHEGGRPTLDVRGGRVFVGSSDHGVYAILAHGGRHLWRFQTHGPVQSEPLYVPGEEVLYVGSNDGALYKLDAKTGTLLWRFMSNAQVTRKPVLASGVLFFANANDTVIAVDPSSGKMKWNYHRSPIGGMAVAGHAGVAVHQGVVLTGFSDGHVVGLDAQRGTPLWEPIDLSAEVEQSLGLQTPDYFDVDTTPEVYVTPEGAFAYVGNYTGGVFAIDIKTGAQLWSNDRVSGVSELFLWEQPAHPPRDGGPMQPARTLLVASTGRSGLWGLDPLDGTEAWRLDLPVGGVSAPAAVSGALMVSTSRHGIFLIEPTQGKVIDGIDLGMGFSMPVAAYGTRAFVLSDGGSLLGLHVAPPVR